MLRTSRVAEYALRIRPSCRSLKCLQDDIARARQSSRSSPRFVYICCIGGFYRTHRLTKSHPCLFSAPLSIEQMQSRGRSLEVHEFEGSFLGKPGAHFKMTSVIGHVLSLDFPPAFQSWETTDPASLFSAPTLKSEANPKVGLD